jgi:putative transposase
MTKKVLKSTALHAYVNTVSFRGTRATCTKIAKSYSRGEKSISHDTLQQLLDSQTCWEGELSSKNKNLLKNKRGWLIIDDTVIDKRWSKEQPHLSWVWSSSDQCYVYGLSCVLLIWTDGNTRVPLGMRFWKSSAKRTKLSLAMDLLNEAKTLWNPHVDYVVFDSWYSSAAMMKHVESLGWDWLCRIKCNRIINGNNRVDECFPHRFGSAEVTLNKGISAFVVKEKTAFFATSKKGLTPAQLKKMYQGRQWVEEVIRILKSSLHLEDCSARSERAQKAHVYLCLMAFCLLERFRIKYAFSTMYKFREELFECKIPPNFAWNLHFLTSS